MERRMLWGAAVTFAGCAGGDTGRGGHPAMSAAVMVTVYRSTKRVGAVNRVPLQLAAHPTDAALPHRAAIAAAATVLGIAHEFANAHASAHAHFKTSHAGTKTACARLRDGALIAAPAAVLAIGDVRDRV